MVLYFSNITLITVAIFSIFLSRCDRDLTSVVTTEKFGFDWLTTHKSTTNAFLVYTRGFALIKNCMFPSGAISQPSPFECGGLSPPALHEFTQ